MCALLEVKNIHTYYGNIKALEDVSITVNRGEIVAIIGNNGAGKTTLINTITGILTPKKGKIFFDNKDITGEATDELVKKGIVQIPEGREVFTDLTVEENLELGAYFRFKKEPKDKIYETIEFVYSLFPPLKQKRNKPAGILSGGEQQMLAIGRGLMAKPKLMLLDEPSLGLAPLIVEEVFNVIRKLRDEGVSILVVEQNAYSALKNSNRGYIIEIGKIILEDKSENLLKNRKVQESFLGKRRRREVNE